MSNSNNWLEEHMKHLKEAGLLGDDTADEPAVKLEPRLEAQDVTFDMYEQ